jgi:hypothetical protein
MVLSCRNHVNATLVTGGRGLETVNRQVQRGGGNREAVPHDSVSFGTAVRGFLIMRKMFIYKGLRWISRQDPRIIQRLEKHSSRRCASQLRYSARLTKVTFNWVLSILIKSPKVTSARGRWCPVARQLQKKSLRYAVKACGASPVLGRQRFPVFAFRSQGFGAIDP